MPVSGCLDKDWIDQNYSYLQPRLGTFPVFEPSAAFYDDLALYAADQSVSISNDPVRKLFSHVGLPPLAVHFEEGIQNAGEFRFSQHPNNAGMIVPVNIRIAEKYRQIGDPQRRGMAIGTILAHEIAHCFMLQKMIRRETTDNERLTDLGLVMLGFGKLWFNGRNLIVEDRSEQLGYLKPLDMTYAYMEFAKKNSLADHRLKSGLTPDAVQVFTFWLGQVTSEVRQCRQQEAKDRALEAVQELAAERTVLEGEVQKVSQELGSLRPALAAAADTQEILNRTHRFWDIPAEDHGVMAAFVTARSSGAQETELATLTRMHMKLRQDVYDLGIGLQQPAAVTCDPAIWRKILGTSREALQAIAARIAALRKQAATVAAVHERCFLQMESLHRDLQAAEGEIAGLRKSLAEIHTFHAFLTANPACWPAYAGESELHAMIALLAGPDREDPFSALEQELGAAGKLAALPRQRYAGTLETSRSLGEIRARIREERDSAAGTRQTIAGILAAQEQFPRTYLEEARRPEAHLHELRTARALLEKDIGSLKPRQDRIYAAHDRLAVTDSDGKEFADITRAILSCSPEAELSSWTRSLEGVTAALSRDLERVRDRKEGSVILPLEAHEKAIAEARYKFGVLNGQVAHWKQVQQGYIDQLDAAERRPVRNLLHRAGNALLGSVRRAGTGKRK